MGLTFEEFELALAPSLGVPGKPSHGLDTDRAARLYDYLTGIGADIPAILKGTGWPPENPDARIMLKRICSEFEAELSERQPSYVDIGGQYGDFTRVVTPKLEFWVREFRSVLDKETNGQD